VSAPATITIGELLDQTTAKFPEKEAVIYPEVGLRYTFSEFQSACNRVAKGRNG
jgi:fatty-acyl-CoA synthase